ncbi:MAG TPA: peptidylprolyl isomerase [Geobacteraceae bacterium]
MSLLQASLRKIVFCILLLSVVSVARAGEVTSGAVQDPVARVNGRDITAAELKHAVDALLATEPGAKLSPDTLKKVKINVLEDLISRELIYQAGMKLEIKDLEKQVGENLAQEKARFDSKVAFEKELSSRGMTEKELTDSFRRDIVIRNYIAETIEAKISISEEESRKFYEQNIDKFTQPEQVRLSHILIPADKAMNVVEKKKAREKAENLRKELLGGADFAALARKYSEAPDSKMGGDMGYLTREQMPQSFAQAAFALKPGELSGVVETKAGFDIISMRDRRPAVTTPFADLRAQIETYLKRQKTDAALQRFLQEARKSGVEVLLK